jgi:hypothetical protein
MDQGGRAQIPRIFGMLRTCGRASGQGCVVRLADKCPEGVGLAVGASGGVAISGLVDVVGW